MEEGTLVNIHIPFLFNQRIFTHGKIVWTRWDELSQAQLYGIHLEEKGIGHYPVFVSLESRGVTLDLKDFDSKDELLLKVLKDAFLLKKGVLIYLKHLIPYFTRITDYPTKDYARLKDVFLNDVFNRVKRNGERLKSLYERLQTEVRVKEDIAAYLDLEDLRDMVESEIYLDIFKAAFDTENILPYMNAIKLLENRLYVNYNTVVMIYIHSL